MRLYFEDRFGKFRLIDPNVSEKESFKKISDYVHKLNPNFHIYYVQTHQDPIGICYDVGSYTEFFYLTDKILDE